ncbi:hypothetical protein [Dictyobacter kobayashii]|uniref:HAMP domain-containing protein n=1 Tax=Dictyobacter kobayashii TaxID=2014872 RepID=A0A402AUZ0_9CHLR|nr:hypothetical protein [Dictyobacter kobayashii]GCE22941.1 hypothetical protein KDK_67410 [Dictyobacter kobayashii]
MANFSTPETPLPRKDWSPAEVVVKREANNGNPLVQWWYRTTSMAEVSSDASFVKRETVRKSQLLSTVLFYYIIVVIVFLPCCLLLPQPAIVWADLGLVISGFVALFLNRQGYALAASLTVVIMFELMLSLALGLITPLDEPSIQLYDLYIMGELLAVSLLPARSVFIFAIVNCLLILTSMLYQPHTTFFNIDMQTQFIPTIVRPIALQFIVAGVSFVWVQSTTKAIARADRAEMVATLEHALGDQKRELEEGIEQILQTHVAVANGNYNARAPLTQDNSLWQIARALNTLLVRLQRAALAEKELQRVEQAVTASVRAVQHAELQHQSPRIPFTQTAIDPLIAVLQGKTLSYTQSPMSQQNMIYAPFPSEGGRLSHPDQTRYP